MVFGGFFHIFSYKWALILKFVATTYELKARKFKDNTSVVILRTVLASSMLSYAEQGQEMHGWLKHYIGSF
jgi:hypothetical protein